MLFEYGLLEKFINARDIFHSVLHRLHKLFIERLLSGLLFLGLSPRLLAITAPTTSSRLYRKWLSEFHVSYLRQTVILF